MVDFYVRVWQGETLNGLKPTLKQMMVSGASLSNHGFAHLCALFRWAAQDTGRKRLPLTGLAMRDHRSPGPESPTLLRFYPPECGIAV